MANNQSSTTARPHGLPKFFSDLGLTEITKTRDRIGSGGRVLTWEDLPPGDTMFQTLQGGDQVKKANVQPLDPNSFVAPDWLIQH